MMEEFYDAKSRNDMLTELEDFPPSERHPRDQGLRLVEEAPPPQNQGRHAPSTRGKKKSPAQANYPEDDETAPFLNSIVTMRKIKGYVNDENLMPTTTYSFLVSNRLGSLTNLINFAVFVLQVSSYAAVVAYVVDFQSPTNPFKFPPNVTGPVRASQFLSLVYSVLVQNMIVSSLYTFRNGFNEEALRLAFPGCSPSSTALKIRWYFALSLLLTIGIFAQLVTFVMIMQSDDVLGVLLNYAAVNFITTIDDRFFYLGKRGWFGPTVEKNVRLVALADNIDPKPAWYRRFFHSLAILTFFGLLLSLWVAVVNLQTSGRFLPQILHVEFGDSVDPSLGTFSGFYDILPEERKAVFSSNHASYVERRSGKAFFGYCADIDAWTFTYNVTRSEYNACQWNAKSSSTEKFDLVTTVTSQWTALDRDGRSVPMDRLDIRMWSCANDEGLCGHGQCSVDDECVCDEGFFGIECEFRTPCTNLEVDGRFGNFEGVDRQWSRKFQILNLDNETITVHDRPVYITTAEDSFVNIIDDEEEGFDIIFFTGRRWALAFSKTFDSDAVDEDPAAYFETFHAHFATFTAGFLSEPVTDIKSFPSPDGLTWNVAQAHVGEGIQEASSQESSALLICSECNDEGNPCFYDGTCIDDTATCVCSEGSAGGLCEVPPIGNGRCDPFFNTIEFDFDGGDCCEASCVSSDDILCGRDSTGFLDTGFFFCANDKPIPSGTVNGEPFSEAGTLVALSATGRVMAAYMKARSVGVYDKEGSEWTQRTLIKTCPMADMAIASGPFSSNPIFLPPIVVVVSCTNSENIEVYLCTKECKRNVVSSPLDNGAPYGDLVDINRDGGIILVTSRGEPNKLDGFVDVYRAEPGVGGTVQWSFSDRVFALKDGHSSGPSPILSENFESHGEIERIRTSESWHEAEKANLTNAAISTQHEPFSGDGYVDMGGKGSSLSWTEEIMQAGTYQVSFSYATPNDRPVVLLLDGEEVATLQFEATPSWSNWTVESAYLWLDAQLHTIEVVAANSSGANIDYMTLRMIPQYIMASTLSGSGDRLALVASDASDNLTVRLLMYHFNGTEWLLVGNPMQESICNTDFASNGMLDLSFDGKVLLFSSGSAIRVYNWNETASEWNQRGQELALQGTNTSQCYVEYSTLSSDGTIVATNLLVDDDRGYLVITMSWEESRWNLREGDENVPMGSRSGPIALSATGNHLALGLPFVSADLSGSVQTYEYPQSDCNPGLERFRITFTAKPGITKWTLAFLTYAESAVDEYGNYTTNYGNYTLGGGPYYFPDFPGASEASETQHEVATIAEDICVPNSEARVCAILVVHPTDFGGFNIYGDGSLEYSFPQSDEVVVVRGENCTDDEAQLLLPILDESM